MRRLILALVLAATSASAWEEPARGSATRSGILDAIRPHIEWLLGAPVEFVVWDIRADGDVAFASLYAQRPGGREIDVLDTPGARRGEIIEIGEGPTVQALLQRSGTVWVATFHALGATDVWWAWEEFCPVWAPVIPEVCPG